MKVLYRSIVLLLISLILGSCITTQKTNKKVLRKEEPVVIKNDSLEYEVIIIDVGFNNYLNTIAKPRGFYSQVYLENKNTFYVTNWNYRASNPVLFNSNIYENIIDYKPNINYGYEVNYKLFNYFEFAQQKYRMRLR